MKIKIPRKIVGLDLSLTSTGIVSYETPTRNEFIRVVKTNNKLDYFSRYNKILIEIKSEAFCKDVIFFIEGYSLGSFSKSTAISNLIELGGIVRFYLWECGLEFVIVPPTTLKKFITGKGNSKKEDMKLHLYKKYGKEFESSDTADAYGLMSFGYSYLTGNSITGKDLTITERDCISKLKGDGNDA